MEDGPDVPDGPTEPETEASDGLAPGIPQDALLSLPERRSKALTLRRRGGSYRQIAATMLAAGEVPSNYCEINAWRDVRTAVKRVIEKMPELSQEVVTLDTMRLDRLLMAIMPAAESGDLEAVDRVLNIMARRASLLGLDKAPPPIAGQQNILVAVSVRNSHVVVREAAVLGGPDQDAGQPVTLLLDRGRYEDGEDGGVRSMAGRTDRSG